MKKKLSFKEWMNEVDEEVVKKTGFSVYDLPDFLFDDAFKDGKTPVYVAKKVIKQAKEEF